MEELIDFDQRDYTKVQLIRPLVKELLKDWKKAAIYGISMELRRLNQERDIGLSEKEIKKLARGWDITWKNQ